jgi:predicted HNH restriction endonuclease
MRRKFNKRSYEKLRGRLEILDDRPDAWVIFGEEIKDSIGNLWDTLEQERQRRRKLLGRTGESRTTNVYRPDLQQKIRREKFFGEGQCKRCGNKLEGDIGWAIAKLEHIIPIAEGGETTHENTQLLCANCHDIIHLEKRKQ